jgi:hypothetical protein
LFDPLDIKNLKIVPKGTESAGPAKHSPACNMASGLVPNGRPGNDRNENHSNASANHCVLLLGSRCVEEKAIQLSKVDRARFQSSGRHKGRVELYRRV